MLELNVPTKYSVYFKIFLFKYNLLLLLLLLSKINFFFPQTCHNNNNNNLLKKVEQQSAKKWGEEMGSQWVPIMCPICSSSSQCVPQHILHSTSLLSDMLQQMLSSFHLYRWAKEEELYTSNFNLLFCEMCIVSFFLK